MRMLLIKKNHNTTLSVFQLRRRKAPPQLHYSLSSEDFFPEASPSTSSIKFSPPPL